MLVKNSEYIKSDLFLYIVCSEDNNYSVCIFKEEIAESYKFYAIESVLIEDVHINCLWQSRWHTDIDNINIEIPMQYIDIEDYIFGSFIYITMHNELFQLYKNTLDWKIISRYNTSTGNYINKTNHQKQIEESILTGSYFYDDDYTYVFIAIKAHELISTISD